MEIQRFNEPESLDLDLEFDYSFDESLLNAEVIAEIGNEKIVLCGDDCDRSLSGVSYVWVDPNYDGLLSPAQWSLWQLLVTIQEGSIYTITSVQKLSKKLGLNSPLPTYQRLHNLQSVDAIHGFRG